MLGTLAPTSGARSLTVEEQLHVDGIGIHDYDILAEMEEHADDVLPCCQRDCKAGAAVRIMMRCCPHFADYCDSHHGELRRLQHLFLMKIVGQGMAPKCTHCSHLYPLGSTYDDIYREVRL